MGGIKSYRDLVAWQKAMELCHDVYQATAGFPREELFGLVQQIRKAAASVACNIAEGWGRGTSGDYVRFLRTARGSLCEVETQILLSQNLGYVQDQVGSRLLEKSQECSRVLQGLLASVQRFQA